MSSVDYVFALCNVPRFDLVDSTANSPNNYKESPSVLKMRHDTGELIFFKHLPIDSYSNVMPMNGLFVEQVDNTNKIWAAYRYRYSSTAPVQTFAAVKFDE